MLETEPTFLGLRLRSLLGDVAETFGASDFPLTSCCGDSRQCQPGDVFFAMIGAEADGHYFVDRAIARGAAAIVAERFVPTGGLPLFIVEDSREAYGRVCQALAGDPSRRLHVIGVTGTSGKSTTVELIRSVLEVADLSVGTIGTLGCYDGVDKSLLSTTTPAPPQLAIQLAKMAANGCSHVVIEADSRALSQSRLAGIEIDLACITNIRRDHLNYHHSVDNYRKAKAKLIDCLSPQGLTVLNVDDAASTQLLARLTGPVLTVGTGETAQVAAVVTEQFRSEQTFLLLVGEETAVVRTRMIGLHHVYNCLSAAAVGLAYGLDLTTIVRGLEQVAYLPRRMERIEYGQEFGVFVDCASSSDALSHSLEAVRAVTCGRVICVLGAEARDADDLPLRTAAVCRQSADAVVLTSGPTGAVCGQTLRQMQRECSDLDELNLEVDRIRAIRQELAMAREGDTVLVAGSADAAFQYRAGGAAVVDDREVVRQWLYEMVTATHVRQAA
jgi:UDP-N-acetylmuramoyl-L-alanyl-D-glutamate--2,6-diaminopimelate ligase